MSDRTEAMENLIEPCPNDLVQRLRADVFYGDARLANMDKHNPLHMEAADRIEALQAEVTRLKDKLSVETEPSPYCPICASCGEEGCCGSRRCLYPAALQEQSK